MTYETKNITFHVIRVKVSSDSRCSRERERDENSIIIIIRMALNP